MQLGRLLGRHKKQDSQSVKAFDTVAQLPLTPLRARLFTHLRSGAFSGEDLALCVEELSALARAHPKDPAYPPHLAQEYEVIQAAFATGALETQPDLSYPATQLLWAMHMIHALCNPGVTAAWPERYQTDAFARSYLWQQLVESHDARRELTESAFHLFNTLRNPTTTLNWGGPNSWFYFDPAQNHVNRDFLTSLLTGFEHSRAVMIHEAKHAELTTDFPAEMQAIREEMQPLTDKADAKGALTPEEYARLDALSHEFQARMGIFNAAEDNPINRATAEESSRSRQDYGYSLNVFSTIAEGPSRLAATPPATAGEALRNLRHAINMVFFQHNDAFADDPAAWEKHGVFWDHVRGETADGPLEAGQAAAYLRELVGGPDGLEHRLPRYRDKLFGPVHYDAVVRQLSAERGEIVDHIWHTFGLPLYRELAAQRQEELQQQMQRQQTGGQDSGAPSASSPQQAGGQGSGGGEPGQNQPPSQSGEPQEQSAGSSRSTDAGGEAQPQDGQPSGGPQDQNQPSPSAEPTGGGQQAGGQPSPQSQSGAQGESQPESQTVTVEGVGEMPRIPLPAATPTPRPGRQAGQNPQPDDAGQNAQNTGAQPQGPTVEALIADARARQAGQDEAENAAMQQAMAGLSSAARMAGSAPRSYDFTLADWSRYQDAVLKHEPEIHRVEQMFRLIQERQRLRLERQSRDRSLFPEDGDFSRLDQESYRAFVIREYTGQPIDYEDVQHFRQDDVFIEPAQIEVVIMIDGSGSMEGNKIRSAVQTGGIIYEGAKRCGCDTYINIWGDAKLRLLAQPDDDPTQIGRAIAGALNAASGGTDLAPAVIHMTRTLAGARHKSEAAQGYTHFIIVSDGDINDPSAAKIAIDRLLQHCPYATVDMAIINTSTETEMAKLGKGIQPKEPGQRVNIVHASVDTLHERILDLLYQRMQMTDLDAVPAHQKSQAFQKASAMQTHT